MRSPSSSTRSRRRAASTPGRVTATLIVEAESQQGILVGKDGATVRAIGTAARPRHRGAAWAARSTSTCASRCAGAGGATTRCWSGSGCERARRRGSRALARGDARAADGARRRRRAVRRARPRARAARPSSCCRRSSPRRARSSAAAPVRVVAAVGLPFGAEGAAATAATCAQAVADGADALDVVVSLPLLANGDYPAARDELARAVAAAGERRARRGARSPCAP